MYFEEEIRPEKIFQKCILIVVHNSATCGVTHVVKSIVKKIYYFSNDISVHIFCRGGRDAGIL